MAVMGIDEVGRGPWAGPLVMGAVILPDEKPEWVAELKDSKKLSPKKRKALSELIWAEAPAVGLGWVSAAEIDEAGLGEALRLATWRAVAAIKNGSKGGKAKFEQIIIDGTTNFLAGTPLGPRTTTIVKGDSLIKEISAASIVAKVARDEYMCRMAEKYPEYGFEKHKGYGTKLHREALAEYGACEIHRLSLEPIRRMYGVKEIGEHEEIIGARRGKRVAAETSTEIGQRAEGLVAECLVREGHEIVVRNYRTQICEIDIVSRKDEELYFTEVKYRKNDMCGGGLAAVTPRKVRQMEFAAKVFLHNHYEFGDLQPMLATVEVVGDEVGELIILNS